MQFAHPVLARAAARLVYPVGELEPGIAMVKTQSGCAVMRSGDQTGGRPIDVDLVDATVRAQQQRGGVPGIGQVDMSVGPVRVRTQSSAQPDSAPQQAASRR